MLLRCIEPLAAGQHGTEESDGIVEGDGDACCRAAPQYRAIALAGLDHEAIASPFSAP
jgi:hypothetical protein